MLTRTLLSIQKRGIGDTFQFIFYELYFDLKYNVETRNIVSLDRLSDVSSSDKLDSIWYQPTPYYILRQSLASIRSELKDGTFLDYGCGKGRVLIAAAEFGVKHRYGVDFSKDLCDLCCENLMRAKRDRNCTVTCQNAADFVVPPEVNVIFFFNPFMKSTIVSVAEQIEASLKIEPRDITILYHTPHHKEAFLALGFTELGQIHQRNPGDSVSILKYVP